MMQRQFITPAQQALIEYRNGMLTEKQYRDSVLENQGEVRNDISKNKAANLAYRPLLTAASNAGLVKEIWPEGTHDENGAPIAPNPDGLKKLDEVQKLQKQYGMTPAVLRTAKAVVEGSGLPEEKQSEALKVVLANGGKFPVLPPAELKDISAQDDIVRSTRKLSDILDSYKGTIGPGNFVNALIGKYVGSDPELQKLNQTYAQLKRGEVVKYAGKTITPAEINLVLEAVGTPNQPSFRQNLAQYQQAQTESLSQKLNSVTGRGIHLNPSYEGLVNNTWGKNLTDSITELGKKGIKISTPYTFGGGDAPANSESEKANSLRSKYNY